MGDLMFTRLVEMRLARGGLPPDRPLEIHNGRIASEDLVFAVLEAALVLEQLRLELKEQAVSAADLSLHQALALVMSSERSVYDLLTMSIELNRLTSPMPAAETNEKKPL